MRSISFTLRTFPVSLLSRVFCLDDARRAMLWPEKSGVAPSSYLYDDPSEMVLESSYFLRLEEVESRASAYGGAGPADPGTAPPPCSGRRVRPGEAGLQDASHPRSVRGRGSAGGMFRPTRRTHCRHPARWSATSRSSSRVRHQKVADRWACSKHHHLHREIIRLGQRLELLRRKHDLKVLSKRLSEPRQEEAGSYCGSFIRPRMHNPFLFLPSCLLLQVEVERTKVRCERPQGQRLWDFHLFMSLPSF